MKLLCTHVHNDGQTTGGFGGVHGIDNLNRALGDALVRYLASAYNAGAQECRHDGTSEAAMSRFGSAKSSA